MSQASAADDQQVDQQPQHRDRAKIGGFMSVTARYSASALFGPTLKASAFLLALCIAIFCASAGYGLLKTLLGGMSRGASIGISEFVTHSGLTIVFIMLAGLSTYAAKKCYW